MSVTDFLQGRSPTPRVNGAASLDAAFWLRVATRLGDPERPELARVLALIAEEDEALRRESALGKQALTERLVTQGILPAAWAERRLGHRFDGAAAENVRAFQKLPVWWMAMIASLGAAQLQTVEALLLEARAHASGRTRRTNVYWACATADNSTVDDEVFFWLESLDTAYDWTLTTDQNTALEALLRRDLDARPAKPRSGPRSTERLLAACREVAYAAVGVPGLSARAHGMSQKDLTDEMPRNLIERRLWSLAFLEAAEAQGEAPAATSALMTDSGWRRDRMLAFLRPLGALYAMGLYVGLVTRTTADVLIPAPDVRWAWDLAKYDDAAEDR